MELSEKLDDFREFKRERISIPPSPFGELNLESIQSPERRIRIEVNNL
jgi:hypothetical protein